MATEEYKSNSHKSKEQSQAPIEKKVEKVISGSAKSKKKGGIQKFTGMFVPEDVDDVKAFLGVNGSSRGKSSASSRVSYRKYYDDRERRDSGSSNHTRSGYEYDDIIIENRGEAEDVLSRMDELIDQYGLVSVADLYDLVGINGNYTDNKYGWFNIRTASVVRVRDGYMIKLPKAVPLN